CRPELQAGPEQRRAARASRRAVACEGLLGAGRHRGRRGRTRSARRGPGREGERDGTRGTDAVRDSRRGPPARLPALAAEPVAGGHKGHTLGSDPFWASYAGAVASPTERPADFFWAVAVTTRFLPARFAS